MNYNKRARKVIPLLTTLGLLAITRSTQAVPYGCDVTNNAGVVSFRLNENADNVKIISSSGAVTNDLGPGVKGLTVTNLGVAAGVIKVMVTRSVAPGYTQATVDLYQNSNGTYVNKFEQPRGVVVNNSPSSPSFGRIYISNGQDATTGSPALRHTYDGIYMLNSDDSVALDTEFFPRTAGLPFDLANAVSPFRLTIGKNDGLLYIADNSDSAGGLWVCDPEVATNSVATNVFDVIGDASMGAVNHGSVFSAVVEGSQAGGDLRILSLDEDLTPPTGTAPSIWRYDLNASTLPYTGAANFFGTPGFINTSLKIVKGGVSNYVYASQNRSAGTDGPSIVIFAEDGTEVTNSLAYTRSNFSASAADIFRNTTAIDISPDGKTLALLRGSAFGSVLLVPITNGLLNVAGTNSFSIGANGASDNNRDIAYDAAGNLYVVNTATEWFRIFSKGGATVAITGTDGTFEMGTPPTLLSVTVLPPAANEAGPVNGVFTLTRTGDTSVPLTVNYTVSGTATAGSDYTALSGAVTFQAGAASTNITVAVLGDSTVELTETVILTITASGSYGISTGSATVSILDDEPTEISLTLAGSENRLLEGYSAQKLGFTLTRKGLISPALTVNLGYSGAATPGTDFNGPATVAVAAGASAAAFSVTPIDDDAYEGAEALGVTVASGSGYVPGTPAVVNVTVIDDDYPAGTVLFADNFDTDSSSLWTVNSFDAFANSSATFAEDYSVTGYVPPHKPGGTTKGLVFQANLVANLSRNAISASPTGLNLTGDYRLRFKAWNNYNGPLAGGGFGSTYHLTGGVGTTGDHAQFSFGSADGIWFDMNGDGESTQAVGDTSAYAATQVLTAEYGVYSAPGTVDTVDVPRSATNPYYSIWGGIQAPAAQVAAYPAQAGTSDVGSMGASWHTFVVGHETNTVYWVIDGIPIAAVPDSFTTLGPNVFVGWADNFNNTATSFPNPAAMSFGIIDDLRVETIAAAPIKITGIQIVGGNVEVTFTGPAANVATDFKLQSAGTANGGFTDDNAATLSTLGAGSFKAVTASSPGNRFYKIKL